MTKTQIKLRGGTALSALALMGAVASAIVVAAAPAAAQDYTQVQATGRVLGTDGKPLANATVVIKSNDQGFTQTTTTDSSGSYRVPALPQGNYTFTVSASGFETFTDANVSLTQGNAANQFALAPTGTSNSEIVVTAGRVRVADFDRTTTGAVIHVGDVATRVPVARSLRDVILLAPGTVQGSSASNSAFANQAQISGSSFTENAYYVNGLNITEFRQGFSPVTIPFDFYDTVEVKTGGFPAEFGRATGGFVNVITKSGSNTFHGSVGMNWEPNSLRSKSPNTYQADNDFAQSNRVEAIATLSGPIWKDHLFFYGLYNTRSVNSWSGTASATTPAGNSATHSFTDAPFWAGKIDFVPISGQRVEFTYFDTSGLQYNDTYRYNSATNTVGAYSGRTVSRYGGENYVARYTGSFTQWLTLSGAYGKNKNAGGSLSADTVNPRVIDARSGTSVAVPGTNPAASFTINDDTREFYRGDVDLYFKLVGSHHVKFGYDREDLTSTQTQVPIGGGAITINKVTTAGGVTLTGLPINTEYLGQRYFSVGGTFKSRNEAFYLQDDWKLFNDRLALNLGIRDDRFVVNNGLGQTFYKSGDQWGPRLGFSFDVFGDGKAKLFGSFGRTFMPIESNTNIRSAGVQFDRTAYYLFNGFDANGRPIIGAPVTSYTGARTCPGGSTANCVIVSSGSSKDPSVITSQSLKPQYVDEYLLGGEWRVAPRWKVGLTAMYRKLGRALEDAAVDQAAIKYCVSKGFSQSACDNVYGGFDDYVILNPGSGARIKLFSDSFGAGLPDGTSPVVNFSASDLGLVGTTPAKRTYVAATLTVDREFDGKWSLSASYTWSSLKGNYEGGAKSDIGQADTGITEDFDQPGFVLGSYGYLPGHHAHLFKAYGSYAVTDWFTFGANVLVQSPKKFGCLGIVPASVDPFANAYGPAGRYCQGQLVPRASVFESDWRKELNLTFMLKLPVEKLDANLRFDVFNVLNTKSVLEANEVGDTASGGIDPNYKKPVTYQNPRSARIQLRVGF